MRCQDVPPFERFDIVEMYRKEPVLGQKPESTVHHALSTGQEPDFGDYIELCSQVAGGKAVSPKKFLLKHYERAVVYSRKE
jgi:hypothetical protein